MAPKPRAPPSDEMDDDDVIASDELEGSDDEVLASDDDGMLDQPSGDEEDDEEEMFDSDEIDGDGDGATEGVPKPRKARTQPVLTHEEQDELLAAHAGATTSDASVLELEVKELLSEARIGSSHHATSIAAGIQSDLSALRSTLAAVPTRDVTGASLASGFIRELGLEPEGVTMTFKPPLAIACVGSVPLRAALKGPGHSPPVVDVALVMPSDSLHARGHVNYRYHAQRAMYLELVAQALASSPEFKSRRAQLSVVQHDPAKPALLLPGPAAAGATQPAYFLRLLPCAPPSAVQIKKLGPDRNAVRAAVAPAAAKAAAAKAADGSAAAAPAEPPLLPTPVYNAGVVSDALMLLHATLLQRAAATAPRAMTDGLLLLKVWAAQQGISPASPTPCPDGLDGHLAAMLMAHLVQQGKLSASMSALQALRAALHALCDPLAGLPKGVAMAAAAPETVTAAARSAAPKLTHPPFGSLFGGSSESDHGPGSTHKSASDSKGSSCSAAELAAIVAAASLPPLPHSPGVAAYKRSGAAAVWLDPSGWCNLAAHMTKSSTAAVVAAARATLTMLESPRDPDEAFTAAFLTPSSPATAFDYLWAVSVKPCLSQPAPQPPPAKKQRQQQQQGAENGHQASTSSAEVLCKEVSIWREQEAAVETLVKKALGDRAGTVRAIRRSVPAGTPWSGSLSSGLPRAAGDGEVMVGAVVDPTLALRLVDIGPAADDTAAAAKFRAFWGEASELRRFQDGKISEAVVWGVGPGARHTIPDRIVAYAVGRHKPAGGSGAVRGAAGALDVVLRERARGPAGEAELSAGIEPGPEEDDAYVAASRLLDSALDKLSRELRGLEGLALKVVSTLPLSPAARHTSPFPPRPHPLAGGPELLASMGQQEGLARCLDPVDVMVQIENSGKWPAEPVPFAKLKSALGVQLAQALCKMGMRAAASEANGIDVLMDGFAFRLSIYSGRDEAMLAKQAAAVAGSSAAQAQPGAAPTAPGASNSATSWILSSPEALPLVKSWHHGLVAGVAGANPAYAPTVRLAHRWLAAHMLSNHFVPEVVELLVAAVFTQKSAAGTVPGSRVTGLLRFLQLLARHPWAQRPLVLDPETGAGGAATPLSSTPLGAAADAALAKPVALTSKVVRELQRRFDEAKAKGAVPAMWIATPRDVSAVSPWTATKPSRDALSHATALARTCVRAAASLLEAPSTSADAEDDASEAAQAALLAALFKPEATDMEVVVGLRREALPHAHCSLPAALAPRPPKRAGQPDALTAVLEGAKPPAPAKRSRAFLDAFPDKAVEGRGPEALRAELLLGFDPLQSHLLPQLQTLVTLNPHALEAGAAAAAGAAGASATAAAAAMQGPSMATVCADDFGGRLLGLKWSAAAFLPAAPKAHTAHLLLPCAATGLRGTPTPGSKIGPLLAVPNVAAVLAEIAAAGEGMVEDMVPVRSCHKLPC